MQRENLKKGIYFGMIGNILFVAFGLICLLYYYTYDAKSVLSKTIELIAYGTEFVGFGLLVYADYLLIISIRLRRLLKVSFSAYIFLEALMMTLEINGPKIPFYEPYSLWLAIIHAVVSGACCFAFLQLDPENVRFEVMISACIIAIFAGMLGNILGIRVYFSILINAVSFAFMFAGTRFFLEREDISIDCIGDRANEAVFNSSTLFVDRDDDEKSGKDAAEEDKK